MGGGDEGDVAVPAGPGAAFEVVQAEAGFEFAVVVFDAPAGFARRTRCGEGGVGGQVGQPVVGGFGCAVGPFGEQRWSGREPSGLRGMSRFTGLTRTAANWLLIWAWGLPGPVLVPWRQVISVNASRGAGEVFDRGWRLLVADGAGPGSAAGIAALRGSAAADFPKRSVHRASRGRVATWSGAAHCGP